MNVTMKKGMRNRVSQTKRDKLRELLRRHTEEARNEAIENNGQVSADKVEAIERLSRLVSIYESVQLNPSRKHWPVVVILVITLLIVSGLLFSRVSRTEIELDVTLTEVGFIIPTPQVLTEMMVLSALGVSGIEEVQLLRNNDQLPHTFHTPDGMGSAMRVSTATKGKRQGTVTLDALPLPAGTRVRLRSMIIPHQYRLYLEGIGLVLHGGVHGPVNIGLAGVPVEQLDIASPKSIKLRLRSDGADVDLMLPEASHGMFPSLLLVNDISFSRIEEFVNLSHSVVRRVSTLLSGTLYFEELNGKQYLLRAGESLHFKDIHGEIRTLQLHDNDITLKFHGYVRGMRSGSGESLRNLMPTYLEWLQARHGLSLLWGTSLYFFGLIAGGLRWWMTRS